KTLASNRDVFIQEQLAPVVEEVFREMAEQQRIYGYPPTVYFFTGTTGNRIGYDRFNRVLGETSQRVLHRKVTPHTLRHTHASLLAAQGVDLETIVRRLGHEDSRITREVYLHQTEQLKKRDAEQVQNIHLFG
ncbi:MAG: tyrosine-type recombinase/integrase, partial [Eubacterium sp.]|nr:tyrosine-type recombinase/integrase [Eubacterium sp.]